MTDRLTHLTLALLFVAGCGRLSGGGGGTPKTIPLPPPADVALLSEASLSSVVLDASRALLRWTAPAEEAASLVLFVGDDAATLFDGAPHAEPLKGDQLIVTGLTEGGMHVFGLARASVEGGFQPVGEILSGRARAPIFVDIAASAQGADGLTPQSAYNNPLFAMLDAFVAGEANIWFAGGDYTALSLPPLAAITLSGGFDSSFALELRDTEKQTTHVHGIAGKPIVTVEGDSFPIVLDGFSFEGDNVASFGVSASAAPVELRGVTISQALGAGLRLTAAETGLPLAMRVIDTVIQSNGAEGISARGSFDAVLRSSRFLSNQQEGVDFDDLVAADGGSASLTVSDCQFASNGTDGLDCDLAQPLTGGFFGGLHRVRIDNSRFEQNGAVGLLLDVDYPPGSGWNGTAILRGVLARANVLDGLQLDIDAELDVLVHRTRSAANGRNGVLLTSDVLGTQVLFSTSAFVGNLGAGLRANEGQATALLSHVYFAGNQVAGLLPELSEASNASSLAWLQPTPWQNSRAVGSVAVDKLETAPLSAQADAFLVVNAQNGAQIELAAGQTVPNLSAAILELSDDGMPRGVLTQLGATTLQLDPEPAILLTPAALTVWPPGSLVEENYTLSAGSAALDAGLSAPGATSTDAGVLGAPLGGTPGTDAQREALFWLADVDPPIAAGLNSDTTLRLRFVGGVPDVGTVNGTQIVARGPQGVSPTLGLQVLGDTIEVVAIGGWPLGAVDLEIHRGLAALDGTPLCVAALLPLEVLP